MRPSIELKSAIPLATPSQPAKVLLVVPAFNEAASIGRVVTDLAAQLPEATVLVINDGSRDETSALARAAGCCTVVDLPCNLGIGGAVQTGFKYAARNGFDVAVQVDGDGQHKAEEIRGLVAALEGDRFDMVIGSRFLGIESFRSTALRRVGIRVFEVVNSLAIKQRITDSTSGFRAYGREAIAFLAQHYPVDYPEPEAVILLGRNGFRIREIPVAMEERQGGRSSIHGLKSAYYMVKVMLAIGLNLLRAPVRTRGA
ncbi:MAG TPA: glycosyltransferase family 2 protein [Pantanalinema sp.]